MGGYYYTTQMGDMWDYIAWKVYSDELKMQILLEAPENKEFLDTYIFSQGKSIWCPYIEESEFDEETPEWRDFE